MKKRLVAFLLVLIMVLGMLPVSAMAAGSVVTARGSAENPIRIYENSGNQAETSNGSVQVPVGETVTDSGVLTFSTYSAIEGVQVSKGGVYCAVTSSNENVVKATGSWSGGVLTINFLGVGNGTAKITVDYTCTCSKNAVANGLLIYNVTVGDGGSTDPSGKPNAPTASDIGAFPDAGKAVLLHCVDAGARGHDATASSLNKVQNGYSVGEVVENPGTYYNVDGGKITKEQFPWMCVVTVHAAPFIELYNSNFSERYGVHKLAGTSNATATLHWFWHNTYGWQYLENPPIQFNITRDTSEKTYTLNYYKNTTDTVTNMPEPNPQTEKSNTGMVTFTVSSAIPAREGYNFLGWNGKPDAPSKTMILDEYNKVLTFSYSANTYDYTVRHIKQLPDGSYDEANAEVETLSGKFEALAAVTAKDYGEHYPTNDADTKQNIKIEEGLTIDVKYDLDEHTLTFETNGGSAINPVTVRHGNAVARPADPTKDKYTFIGWYADPEFTEEYDFATVLEADKTIYAKFELTSTPIGDIYVRYDVLHIKQLPDGTYDLANAEVEHLSAKKDTTVTAVIKDYRATHHVNVNRTLSKLTGTAIQPYKGVDGKPVYTILSVYYDLDFHTLTFDTMGGSKIAPETVRHGLTVAKPKDPVNGGYIFDGWYTDKTYRTPYNFATPLTQDTTIYAKWFLIVLPGVTDKKATPKLNTSDHFAYVQGYPNGTVKPAGNITRAETAAILFRLMDDASRKTYYSTKSGFRDVASGSWYNTYVATLNNAGVITDSSNGYFRPNEAITRAELAAMLAKFSETTGAANYFNDVSAKYWAANAIAICAKLGWINGYPDGTFRPDKNVTRAELMAMINRATGRAPKSADAFLPGMKTWIDNTSDKWYYLDVQEATNSHSYTVKGSETWTALTSDPNWSLYE